MKVDFIKKGTFNGKNVPHILGCCEEKGFTILKVEYDGTNKTLYIIVSNMGKIMNKTLNIGDNIYTILNKELESSSKEQVCYIAHTALPNSQVKVFYKKEDAEKYIIDSIRTEYKEYEKEKEIHDFYGKRISLLEEIVNKFKENSFVTGIFGNFHYIYETIIK